MLFSPQPHLDGKHVVFGTVTAGLEVLQAIEAKGSSSGSPQETIAIADSGQIR